MAPPVKPRRNKPGRKRSRRRSTGRPNLRTSNRGRAAETGGAPREPLGSANRGRSQPPCLDEPFSYFHSAPGRDDVADGGDHAGGTFRLPLPPALGTARGRLSDDPSPDVLSWRQPRRDDFLGYRAARSAVRPNAGPQPDVVNELGRRFGDHAPVQPRPHS